MKDIKNYEGLYAVTEDGRVWSYKNSKWLNPLNNRGYQRVQLCKEGKRIAYSIHRLVAETYLPNPKSLPCVNHKNEIKTDNRVENLEWCTVAYNNSYGTHLTQLMKSIYCEELARVFTSVNEAASTMNINQSSISNCLAGRRKTAGGYHFEYI